MTRRRAPGSGRVVWNRAKAHYIVRYQDAAGRLHERGHKDWTTLGKANAGLAALIAEVNAPAARHADAGSTVAAYLAAWLEDKAVQVRPRTLAVYRHQVRLLGPLIGAIPLAALTPRHVQTAVTRLVTPPPDGGGYAPSTVIRTRTMLLSALGDAETQELIRRNPVRGTRPPRDERPEPRAMAIEEARAILASVAGTRLHAAVALALCYGLRNNEVCGLRWDAITEGEVRIVGQLAEDRRSLAPTKTRRATRVLPLVPAVVTALAETPRTGAHVVTDLRGRPLRRGGLYELWKRHQARVGLSYRTFHELRHGAVSLLAALGISDKLIAEIVGHAEIRMTHRYTHFTDDQRTAALGRLAGLLSDG